MSAPKAVRVRTSSGWQDIALVGPPGPAGPMGPIGTVYDTDQIGTVKAFTGTVIPTNWILADGRTLQRADYPQLADEMAIPGAQATFQIPDLRKKFIYGKNAPADAIVGGGAATHILTVAELAVHGHGAMDRSIDHLHYAASGTTLASYGGANWLWVRTDAAQALLHGVSTTGAADRSLDHLHQNAGSGTAHNNMPPYVELAWIIKVTGVQLDSGGALVGATGPAGTNVPMPDDSRVTVASGGPVAASAGFTAATEVYMNSIGDLRASITPTRNCWWRMETTTIIQISTPAGWSACECEIWLDIGTQKTDANGEGKGASLRTRNHQGTDWSGVRMVGMFKLEAGKQYTARPVLTPCSASFTWAWWRAHQMTRTHSFVCGYW